MHQWRWRIVPLRTVPEDFIIVGKVTGEYMYILRINMMKAEGVVDMGNETSV